MANQYLAKLGILLSVDSAELSKGFSDAAKETKNFERVVENQSKKAIADIQRMRDAVEDYGKEVSNVTKIEREFREGGRYALVAQNEAIRQSLLKEAAAMDAVVASSKKMNASKKEGLTPYQIQALSYQTTDIFTSLAGGQNPMLVLLQQGGQLKDQFGGITNVFKAFAQVLTPLRLAMIGIGGALATVAYGFYEGDKEAQKFRDTLILTNNAAGVTADSFRGLATLLSSSMNIGIRDAKDILNQLIATGKFTTEAMIPVGEAIAKIAKLSGESADNVAKALIPSFDGSAASAKTLNQTYNFLTVAQYKQIELLEQQNKKQEAVRLTAELLNESLNKQKRDLGVLEKAINATSKAWQEFKDNLFAIGRPETISEKMEAIRSKMETNFALMANSPALRASLEKRNNLLISEYAVLAQKMEKEQEAANKKAEENDANQAAIRHQNLKEQQDLDYQLRQKYIDEGIAQAAVGEDKIANIRVEAIKKMAKASLDFEKAIVQGGGKNQDRLLRNLKEDFNAITAETNKQIAEVSRQEAKKFQDKQAAEQLAIDQEREKLNLYKENIALSDSDLQIALNRLQIEKNIADIMRSGMDEEAKQRYIEREQALGRQKENVIQLGEQLKLLKNVHDSVFNSMGNAVETFVKTGKFAFKDFTKSVILDIFAIYAKAQMLKMLGGASGFLGSLFTGGTNFLGSSALGTGGSTGFGINPTAGGFGIRASGGAVTGNSPYMVGERGAELFVPNTSGTIIPANQVGSAMMGSTVVNNYNINAIDTQSFAQALASNKNAVFAANQSASRGLPASR